MSHQNREGLVLDQEARRFLGTTGLVVVGIEVVVLLAMWFVQRYFS